MRKMTFGVANSLDHYIARENHAVDWLLFSDEAKVLMEKLWKDTDAIVMGRKTYEVALQHSSGGDDGAYAGIKTYVMSRSLTPDPARDRGAEIVADDAVEFVRALKEQDGKEIVMMGGGELAKPLLEAGLIDELGLNIHPVLLGSGIPLFRGLSRQISLELLECQRFANGCVYLLYRVAG